MLPIVTLDNEYYEEIFEKAKKMIPRTYKEWTDYNEHDPGITFLQLFSWFKEMQQFHLDQIGTEHFKMYLEMLGMKQRKKIPAKTVVKISEFEESFFLPHGSKIMAGDIPFETICDTKMENVHIIECVFCSNEAQKVMSNDLIKEGKKLKCFPFGKYPKEGNSFLIKLNRPLEKETIHSFYFDIFEEYEVKRNKIEENFYPLAELCMEYYGEDGFSRCEEVEDGTNQFLNSGMIKYKIPTDMKPMDDGSFGIRICLTRCEYDLAPILQSIYINVAEVEQICSSIDYEDFYVMVNEKGNYVLPLRSHLFLEGRLELYWQKEHTWKQISYENIRIERKSEELILHIDKSLEMEENVSFRVVGYTGEHAQMPEYKMNGFPYQEIDLNDLDILYEPFEIMVEVPEQENVWEQWEKVENFHCSTEESKHYYLDEEKGILVFGDCERGLAPEGRLRIIRYVCSFGNRGNVRKEQIRTFAREQVNAVVCNQEHVSNGKEKETIEECFERFQREFSQIHRAVTANDYETLVLRTPGLCVKKAKVVPMEFMKKRDGSLEENSVSIVVQPYSIKNQAMLSDAYIKNIMQMLDKRRLLGTKVQILAPEYIGVTVFVDVVIKPHYLKAQEAIEKTIASYFETIGSHFGVLLEESELYGFLDAKAYVVEVRNLAMYAQGRGVRRTINGNIKLPVNGLAYLKQVDYVIATGDV